MSMELVGERSSARQQTLALDGCRNEAHLFPIRRHERRLLHGFLESFGSHNLLLQRLLLLSGESDVHWWKLRAI